MAEVSGCPCRGHGRATAVVNSAPLAHFWPNEDRQRVGDALSACAQHGVDVEWPHMAHKQFEESLHISRIHNLWQAVSKAGMRAEVLDPKYAASLQQLDKLDEARPPPGGFLAETDCRKR